MALVDREAEDVLVAACLFKPELFHTASQLVRSQDFGDLTTQAIYKAISDVVANAGHPDPVLIKDAASRLMSSNQLIHDPDDLVEHKIESLRSLRFHPQNVPEYAKKVHRLATLRSLESTMQGVLSETTGDANPQQLAAKAMEKLLDVASPSSSRHLLSHAELREDYNNVLIEEAQILASGEQPGIRFGFSAIDQFTHGLRAEDLLVLAGDPGTGKTSLCMSLGRRRALAEMSKPAEGRKGTLFVSLEMGRNATGMRFSQMIGRMTTRELRSGMDLSRIKYLDDTWRKEDDIPFWTLFALGMRTDELKANIAYMVRKHNVDLVVVDHFGYVEPSRSYNSAYEAEEARMRYIKDAICKSLGVSVILIAHTNKASAAREDKRPRMSDLAGSQKVTAPADYITFVYLPFQHLSAADKMDPACPFEETDGFLVWAKNRNDKKADAHFYFDGSVMAIEDAAYKLSKSSTVPRPTPPSESVPEPETEELF